MLQLCLNAAMYLADLDPWIDLILVSALSSTGLLVDLTAVTGPTLLFVLRCVPLFSQYITPSSFAVTLGPCLWGCHCSLLSDKEFSSFCGNQLCKYFPRCLLSIQ